MPNLHHLPPIGLTSNDSAEAAAWATRRGAGWSVTAETAEDGATWLLVSPPPAFMLQRTKAGIVAFDAETNATIGVFDTLAAALYAGLGSSAAQHDATAQEPPLDDV